MKKESERSIKLKYDIAMGISCFCTGYAFVLVCFVFFTNAPTFFAIIVPVACITSILSVVYAASRKERLRNLYGKLDFE